MTLGEFAEQHWAHELVLWLLEYLLARERKDWPFADFTRDSFKSLGLKLMTGPSRTDVNRDFNAPKQAPFAGYVERRNDNLCVEWKHNGDKARAINIYYPLESSS